MNFIRTLLPIAILLVASCGGTDEKGPITVNVIGGPLDLPDPNRKALDPSERVLIEAVAQGLVRHDADGQIEPGLAVRWAISQDGLYYTFRLRKTDEIEADRVARRLSAAISSRSQNGLKPILGAIDEIVAVTPEVVEIRLKAARPSLLDLLARPELAIIDRGRGTGPFEIRSRAPRSAVLSLIADEAEDPGKKAGNGQTIMLRSARASLAVARFAGGSSDLVLGGRFADFGIVQAAKLQARDVRFDPVTGMFGFTIVERAGFLSDSENRRALAMAIDRDRLIKAFGLPGWQPAFSLVAPGTRELPQPAVPGWAGQDIALRRNTASNAVRLWRLANPGVRTMVRVALPDGPGSKLLFALLRSDWAVIGVSSVRVAQYADADLRLIDEVEPSQTATWYLRRFSCDRSPVCSEVADTALEIARIAPDPIDRAARIADADLRLAEIVPYIPIAQPLRWALVAPRLSGFRTNNRGVHPLNHLLEESR
jgi:peptide/nickel transport system substrate-binding protein